MVQRNVWLATSLAGVALAVACAGSPESPMSPSAVDGATAANPDGSTLKVSAPAPVSPADGSRVDTRRPVVVFNNSTGRFTGVTLSYQLQVFDASGAVVAEFAVPQGAGAQSTFESATELGFDTEFRWRVRATLDGQVGPWSAVWSFKTPQRVVIGTGDSVGAPRSIQIGEAIDIIYAIYRASNWDIGSRSSRDQRNLYFEAATAAIHYGHAKWNPRGPDSSWCIKNGGPGRPQADDVIVLCQSREAWDLFGGIGGNNVTFDWHGIGRLDSAQAVYAPNRAALAILP